MRYVSIGSFFAGFCLAGLLALLIFVFESRQFEVPNPDGEIPAGFLFRGIGTSECISVTDAEEKIAILRYHCGYPISLKEIRKTGAREWQVTLSAP